MRMLALDTATSWQTVAIVEDERVLARRDQEAAGTQAALLLPTIDALLKEAALGLADFDGLACSIGPGSFTGIRVGVATCLGLRAATDVPLVLVPTLEAMASAVAEEGPAICAVLPSRKGEVYWAIFRRAAGVLSRVLPEHVGSPAALAHTLSEATMMVGDEWLSIEGEVRVSLRPDVRVWTGPGSAGKPSAVHVGRIGLDKLRKGEVAGSMVVPLYVQRAEAEVQYEQSGGVSPVARRQARVARKTSERLARKRRSTGGKASG